MTRSNGWVGKILWVNLSNGSIRTLSTSDYGAHYIGGRGIAARLAWESIPRGVQALDPENLLMAFTGPLSGTTAPFSGRTSINGLSPQGWPHEWYGRSNLGGHWGPSLKYAGYDGLVIEGRAERPTYLYIDDEQVVLSDASHLWGLGTIDTQKALMAELGNDIRILTIGPAGERLSRIAVISTETESAAGQGGFGAVMGSKNLKAIVVRGRGAVYVSQPQSFIKHCKMIIEEVRNGNLFASGSLDPERVRKFRQRYQACTQSCAVQCLGCRHYEVNGPLSGEKLSGQFHCVSVWFPGLPDTYYDWKIEFENAFEARHLTDNYGLNHWDLLLGIIPWLRDCAREGVLKEYNGRKIDFNDPEFWAYLLHSVAYREGMGEALAEGGRRAPELLGFGKEQADPLYAAWGSAGHWDGHGDRGNRIVYPFWLTPALQWAVDVRDPLSSSHDYIGMTMHWSQFSGMDRKLSWEAIQGVAERLYGSRASVDPLSDYEDKEIPAVWHGHRSVLKDSATVDDTIFPVLLSYNSPDGWARAGDMDGKDFEYFLLTEATGMDLSPDDLELACERIFNLERAIQVRNHDRQRSDDETVIPYFERVEWWENPYLDEKKRLDADKFRLLLDKYYRLRGWDVARGRPTAARLQRLGLQDVAQELSRTGLIEPEIMKDELYV